MLERYARHLTEIHARRAQVTLALAAAATADIEATAIWRKNVDDRHSGMTMFAADLISTDDVRPDHTSKRRPMCGGWPWTCAVHGRHRHPRRAISQRQKP
jgi:hypothetical protein